MRPEYKRLKLSDYYSVVNVRNDGYMRDAIVAQVSGLGGWYRAVWDLTNPSGELSETYVKYFSKSVNTYSGYQWVHYALVEL